MRCLLMVGLPLPSSTERQVLEPFPALPFTCMRIALLWDRNSRRQAVAAGHLYLNPQP
jgi:hypothetical protein